MDANERLLDARAGGKGYKDDRRDWDHENGGNKKNRWGGAAVEAATATVGEGEAEAGARAGARPPRLELELRPAQVRQQEVRRPGPARGVGAPLVGGDTPLRVRRVARHTYLGRTSRIYAGSVTM